MPAFAAVSRDRDAGNALQRFREVLVGKGGDVLRQDDVLRSGRRFLDLLRLGDALAIARNDDIGAVLELHVRRAGYLWGHAAKCHGRDGRPRRGEAHVTDHRYRTVDDPAVQVATRCELCECFLGGHPPAQALATDALQQRRRRGELQTSSARKGQQRIAEVLRRHIERELARRRRRLRDSRRADEDGQRDGTKQKMRASNFVEHVFPQMVAGKTNPGR